MCMPGTNPALPTDQKRAATASPASFAEMPSLAPWNGISVKAHAGKHLLNHHHRACAQHPSILGRSSYTRPSPPHKPFPLRGKPKIASIDMRSLSPSATTTAAAAAQRPIHPDPRARRNRKVRGSGHRLPHSHSQVWARAVFGRPGPNGRPALRVTAREARGLGISAPVTQRSAFI